jgi:hypothetical protein
MGEPRRILVIANETCAGAAVCDEVRYRAGPGPATVRIVAPALTSSRMGHWFASGDTAARDAAADRLQASLAALRTTGLAVDGQLGDADPLQALDDAYRVFDPDEIIISTHPPARSTWLERSVVQRARDRYPVSVTHVVVDLEHERSITLDDPRPGPRVPPRMITLYRAAGYDEALAVRSRGFENIRDVAAGRSGVLFTDTVPEADEDGATIFVVEVPAGAAGPYEVEPAPGTRRFALPADLVNRHHPRALAADWSE